MSAPLRHRDFRYLAASLAVSQTGDWLYNVALLVLVLEATGSATWVAAAGIVRLLPYVVLVPLGGVVADRYPRKTVMIVSDLVRAGLMAGLGLFALTSVLVRARTIDRRAADRIERFAPMVEMLHALDLFEGTSRATLEALAGELRRESVEPGAVVMREGDPPDDLLIVIHGHLVVTTAARGRVGELRDGDYFGEIGLLHKIPRTATVTAYTPCELYRMPGESFLRLLNEGASQSASLIANLQTRLATTRADPEERPTH
jgi:CRP-like cAMP-binding protein